jgi:hypothetical protein
LVVAQLLAPLENVRAAIIPFSWLLCVLSLSPLGQREQQQGVDSLIFSCASPLKQQFPAVVVAGVLLALLVVGGAVVRFALLGEWFSLLMLLTGALFMVSLALACGALTRTSRTFEVMFVLIWYVGPMQHSPLDFVGVEPLVSQAANAPLMFMGLSSALLLAAVQGRVWQLKA